MVSRVPWNVSRSVKVSRFDEDHKQMFSIIKDLHDAMSSGKGALVVNPTITKLADHMKHHFSAEEEMMGKTMYSELDSHRLEHEEILRQIEQFQRDIAAGKFVSSVTVAEFLDQRLIAHTTAIDRKYSEHLNANGIF